jgi:hypothetical protein
MLLFEEKVYKHVIDTHLTYPWGALPFVFPYVCVCVFVCAGTQTSKLFLVF